MDIFETYKKSVRDHCVYGYVSNGDFQIKTRTTTRTRYSEYQMVRAREAASGGKTRWPSSLYYTLQRKCGDDGRTYQMIQVLLGRYFSYLPHVFNNYKKMSKQMQEEMARRPKRNYRAYVNQDSSITIFRRWHKNYGDGYSIISGEKLN